MLALKPQWTKRIRVATALYLSSKKNPAIMSMECDLYKELPRQCNCLVPMLNFILIPEVKEKEEKGMLRRD